MYNGYLIYTDMTGNVTGKVFNCVDVKNTLINGLALVIVYGEDIFIVPIARIVSFCMEKG